MVNSSHDVDIEAPLIESRSMDFVTDHLPQNYHNRISNPTDQSQLKNAQMIDVPLSDKDQPLAREERDYEN